LEIERKILKK